MKICAYYPEFDVAGPGGRGETFRDCIVNVYDLIEFVSHWLECTIIPTCSAQVANHL